MQLKKVSKMLTIGALSALLLMPSANAFTDVEGHWAQEVIEKWSEDYQIIQGYEDETFRPDDSITRGAFAGILNRFLNYQTASPASTFTDIADSFWATDILKLNAAGVMLGDQGLSMPSATITRQEAVVMIARAFDIENTYGSVVSYDDKADFASYALDSVAAMEIRGYITDSEDGNFRPRDPITRAEMLNILNNMIDTVIQDSGTYTEDVDGTVLLSTGGVSIKDCTIAGDVIVAPGVVESVTLTNVTVEGELRNFSDVTIRVLVYEDIEEEDYAEGEDDAFEFIPGESAGTTGDYIMYNGGKIAVWDGVDVNELDSSAFEWEDPDRNRLAYTGDDVAQARFGVDVSAYQNRTNGYATGDYDIDWEAAAADGVDFSFIRIGLRGTSSGLLYADEYYAQNIDGSLAAGIDTGVYIFSQAISVDEAIEEADFVLELLDGRELTGPVSLDWEMKDSSYRVYGLDPAIATAAAVAFCQRIEAAGYEACVYFSTYVGYIKYDLSQLNEYGFWHPAYVYPTSSSGINYPAFYYQMDYWQYTDAAVVDGFAGGVDGNIQFIFD
ncbi:S-layer homology domain-containing protein [Bengtsoniella intestinalis]|uniref:S-layer homology domain-containing protein n=1 Tax=Bengtsoniella intestinalis TaxID=3073143 RepID=UPI00391F7C7D